MKDWTTRHNHIDSTGLDAELKAALGDKFLGHSAQVIADGSIYGGEFILHFADSTTDEDAELADKIVAAHDHAKYIKPNELSKDDMIALLVTRIEALEKKNA